MDFTTRYKADAIKDSTIFITGGASGIGAAMAERCAELGAHVMIGDINATLGEALATKLRNSSGNPHHYFIETDVSSFTSLSAAFTTALSLSPSNHIHHVIANAGITDSTSLTELPPSPTAPCPPPPTSTLTINLLGVFFTTRLALHHFRLNHHTEDAHLLLVGSMASFLESPPMMAQYTASKHGVLGLFHSLRLSAGDQAPAQFRVNMLCPYFIDTPILPTKAKLLLAGVELAKKEDAVDAVVRLCAVRAARGRCVVVAPRSAGGVQEMDWEELKEIEPFTGRVVGLIRAGGTVRKAVRLVGDVGRLAGWMWVAGALAAMVMGMTVMAMR
ncbi:NAD(P)-binding protein [Ascodesmis nigricans]|uniref:NAD(P)-binding protein n=1 Tax=Ascodesmis nigricans TaxID=341454 RepID=A0A4S2N1Z7_9PEZI|nr:NAD(P)-binding protein [Ascodesmis nigricans]